MAAVYTITARLGLLLDPVGGFASVVWAPTGIALAVVLLWGYRLAAGVLLGAFVANLITGAPAPVAIVIAIGNTLEAIVGVFVLKHIAGFDTAIGRLRDVLAFFAVAAGAPVLSAAVGTTALRVGGILSADQWADAWGAWWVGDAIGALLVAPFVTSWHADRGPPDRRTATESLMVVVAVVVLSSIVFLDAPDERVSFLQTYLLFPPLIWAAVRFEMRGATTAMLLASIIAIAGTARGTGPFAAPELHVSLFRLQTFVGIVAGSLLMLAAAIADRTRAQRALARALDAETRANREKSDFLAAMSHELRTPLNAMAGFTQLMHMDVYGPLTERQRGALARIQRNQLQLTALVEDLLGFISVGAGRLKIDPRDIPVGETLASLAADVEVDALQKEIHFETAPIDDDLIVRADPDKLRQIVLNLLTNAIKYTPAGGRVSLSAVRDGQNAVLRVSDTGIGIPADQLPRVFEPFFQVERGTTRRYPGIGLGLAIARELAHAMRGELTIESVVDKGTTATLTLPAVERPAALAEPSVSAAPAVS